MNVEPWAEFPGPPPPEPPGGEAIAASAEPAYLAFAEESARWCLRRLHQVPLAERRYTAKSGAFDLVTDLDRDVERHVRESIHARFPAHAVVGEEFGRSGQLDAELTWYLDPIDGTTNFAHGLPWASFSLGLADRQGPLVGVVCDLDRGEVFTAVRGGGAWLDGRSIRCADATDVAGQVVLTEWVGNRSWRGMPAMVDRLAGLGATSRIMGSSALALAHVAAGRAAVAVLGAYHPWDVMAGVLVACESGAQLLSRRGPALAPPGDGLLVACPGVALQASQAWLAFSGTNPVDMNSVDEKQEQRALAFPPMVLPESGAPQGRPPDQVLRITHRSLETADRPLDAVIEAQQSGAHLVEADIRVTADGQLVCWHDAELRQPNGDTAWIAELTMAEMSPLAIRPLGLSTVLAELRRAGLGLYADIKALDRPAVEALTVALDEHGLRHRTVLASSRTDLVIMCREVAPDVPRAILFASHDEDPVELGRATGATFVHPCWERFSAPQTLLTEAWLARVRRHGFGVVCWHEERREVVHALYRAGVDAICSDDPALLQQVARDYAAECWAPSLG